MKKIALLAFGMIIFLAENFAQKTFDFTTTTQQAYQDITKLKFRTAVVLLNKSLEQNPSNLIPVLLQNYIDFYTLFLNEDPADYKKLYPLFEERVALIQKGPKSSPFYLYAQAVIRIQRAGVSVKFGNLWDAGWDFRRAYHLLKENKQLFPSFTPNDLMHGALQAAIGTVPKGYRWLVTLLGMKGSVTEGMKRVRNFTTSNDPWAVYFFNEAAFIYPYMLYFIENKKAAALAFAQQKKLDLVNNHLHAYMAAHLALNEKVVELSKSIITNRNKSGDYLKLSTWDFQMGYAKLYHLDIEDAKKYFELFVEEFKGQFYVKDVYQKISWCYYLQGNIKEAEQARLKIISKGSTEADADKKALKDAKSNTWPNLLLLKARLLNDGGYHTEALKLLAGKTDSNFEKSADKLEFTYRVARIYDDLNRKEEAIKTYLIAIRLGEKRKEYFAARAALQIAQIYENEGQLALAIQYYLQCLAMEDHEYKDSLDQRAKAGIARCKGE
ncbi:MAG: hypothetical protein EAZ35_02820 [Sphingobacteriia bacterium]|nr:MAG: hypothetical protein EAZ41_00510 [Sphingobacteriia bacterium]TAG31602.1 MAG: hypothetical protein EAZ35_02820 [Sphingobacteriia bacterium]